MARERGLAQHVPTGLEVGGSETKLRVVSGMKGNATIDPLDERQYGKTIRVQVREFGVVFALLFTAIGAWQWFLHYRPAVGLGFATAALLFFLAARYAPHWMHPVWKVWMAFGGVLGVVVNSVLLGVVWITMVIPMAFVLRLIGKRVMDVSFKAPVDTYWLTRSDEQSSFTLLERQF